ncbi:hypothetical protein PIB30_081298 [Stylosanthes scabra]|uniref:RNase H type-1 domain-containing protein n=1 Tax=Stylosanthes scabra TaxID=79078 RepID=A0ABU6ZQ92_9FABA|nr:hypothetical protein [Stylosanthes scabra]
MKLSFVLSLWWIWRDRNNSVFNIHDQWSSHKVKALRCASITELQTLNNMHPSSLPSSIFSDWIPPSHGRVKINCDASINGYYQRAGFGCVIRDESGLLLAWEYGFRDVICETDCLDAFLVSWMLDL